MRCVGFDGKIQNLQDKPRKNEVLNDHLREHLLDYQSFKKDLKMK